MSENFDNHYQRFKRNIYDTPKGQLRLDILRPDIDKIIAQHAKSSLNILDVGCGMGKISLELAAKAKGHKFTLCDISEKMLTEAKAEFEAKGLENPVSFIQAPLSDLSDLEDEHKGKYDLVICHAVLEWIEDAEKGVRALTKFLREDGVLSLMFYNKNATILKSIMKGNVFSDKEEFKFGRQNNLTPTNPLIPADVYQWLAEQGLKVIDKTGVRVFYDYLDESLKKPENYQKVLQNERLFCKDETFIAIARYIHVVCEK